MMCFVNMLIVNSFGILLGGRVVGKGYESLLVKMVYIFKKDVVFFFRPWVIAPYIPKMCSCPRRGHCVVKCIGCCCSVPVMMIIFGQDITYAHRRVPKGYYNPLSQRLRGRDL